MKIADIAVAKLREKGIDEAEIILNTVYGIIQESATEVAAHPDAQPLEKSVCAILIPVLAAAKPQFETLIDFDKDGKVG